MVFSLHVLNIISFEQFLWCKTRHQQYVIFYAILRIHIEFLDE